MNEMLKKFNLQLFADGGEEGDKSATDTDENKGQEQHSKAFSQEEVDKIVNQRLDRERKKQEKALEDLKKQLGAGGDTPLKGDASQEQPQNEEIVKAQAALQRANQMVIQAQAVTEAVKLGVDAKYIQDAVRLADLSKIEVGEDGNVDASSISKAIDEVLKRVPVFKANADNSGGFKVGGEGQGAKTKDSWAKPDPTKVNRWNRANRI